MTVPETAALTPMTLFCRACRRSMVFLWDRTSATLPTSCSRCESNLVVALVGAKRPGFPYNVKGKQS